MSSNAGVKYVVRINGTKVEVEPNKMVNRKGQFVTALGKVTISPKSVKGVVEGKNRKTSIWV
jgi:hypothetical protein